MSATPPSPEALSAQARLAASRAGMAHWLADEQQAHAADAARGGLGLASLFRGLRRNPVAAFALDALAQRLKDHPVQTAATLARTAADETLAPLVRRHPALVLGTAAAAGALVVRLRPWRWRWLMRPALLIGVATQLLAHLPARSRPGPPAAPKPP